MQACAVTDNEKPAVNKVFALSTAGFAVVREGGVEPPRPLGHTDLNRARLPIPPLALVGSRNFHR